MKERRDAEQQGAVVPSDVHRPKLLERTWSRVRRLRQSLAPGELIYTAQTPPTAERGRNTPVLAPVFFLDAIPELFRFEAPESPPLHARGAPSVARDEANRSTSTP